MDLQTSRFTSVAFFLYSFLDYLTYSLLISGSQDILAGTHVPTSLVVFIIMTPLCLVYLIAIHFVRRIPYGIRITFSVIVGIVGFILIAFVGNIKWKLTGVGFVSFSFSVIDISFLGLMSYFESSAVSAYSTGTGLGSFFGPIYYLAMTTWMCVSPNITFIIMAPLQLLYLLSYYIINKYAELGRIQRIDLEDDVAYTKLESSDTEDSEDKRKHSKAIASANDGLTLQEEFRVAIKMLYIAGLPAFSGFNSAYLLYQSVITTISYENAPFRPRDHYQYYIFIFMFGELVGRSHRFVLSFFKRSWLYRPTPVVLWLFSVLEMLHLFFFIFESWYRFLPSVTTTLFLCLTAGISIGILFNNVIEISHGYFEGKEREFAMSSILGPLNLGVILTALVGLYVEPHFLEHCVSTVLKSAYCVTRSTSFEDVTASCGITR